MGMRHLISTLALIGFLASVTPSPAALPEEFRSPETRVHLIELFSSEGCSSCPPADAWVASLRRSSGLWKQFVPVEFHVDYWNRLGWTDPLSRSLFTARQQAYAREWTSQGVYTPGFVLDGGEWRPSGGPSAGTGQASERVGVLSARRSAVTGTNVVFDISFDSARPLDGARVYGAILGNGLESKVATGENAGSILRHEFAVLGLVQRPMNGGKARYTAQVELPRPANGRAASYSVAFWVTGTDRQAPLQAVGGDLKL